MVFPRLHGEQGIDFMKVGESKKKHLVVRFTIQDKSGKRYILREPIEARETGQLYQLFYREKYPKEIADNDHQFVLTDETDKIVGGITFRIIEDHNVLLDGIVVTSTLQGKGIASGMIEHFFASMAARGVKVVKAHFLFGNYYLKHFFEVDRKWGALIKNLK
jgi:GNAT superfamily N-acetyltransferase